MAEEAQPAARVEDHVQHTQAMLGRRIGGVFGFVAGIAVLAGAIVLAGGLEVVTGGLATPVLIGAGMVAVGGLMGATSAFSDVGADIGRGHFEDEGPISSGEKTVLVGKERQALAHVGSNVSCKRDKHPNTPTIDFPNPAFEQIVQGSDTVLVGIGAWQVSRIGNKGTCGFAVAQGCPSVIVGGPTGTHGPIGNDDPEADMFHRVGAAGGWIMLGGVLLMSGPFAAVAAYGIGKLIGKGLEYLPEGLPRDSVAAVLSLLPMAGLPKAMGSIRAATNEGLLRGTGETPEEFQARVKEAYNARVEAEWNAKVAASKPQGAWIPTDAFGRPIPATEVARAGGTDGVLGTRSAGSIDPTRAPVLMSRGTDGAGDGVNAPTSGAPRQTDAEFRQRINQAEDAGDSRAADDVRYERYLQEKQDEGKPSLNRDDWQQATDRLRENQARGRADEDNALNAAGVQNNNYNVDAAGNSRTIQRWHSDSENVDTRPDGVTDGKWVDVKSTNEPVLYDSAQLRAEREGAIENGGKGHAVIISNDNVNTTRPSAPLADASTILHRNSVTGDWSEWNARANNGSGGWQPISSQRASSVLNAPPSSGP